MLVEDEKVVAKYALLLPVDYKTNCCSTKAKSSNERFKSSYFYRCNIRHHLC